MRHVMRRHCGCEKVPSAGARRIGWAWVVLGLCLVATPARGAENIDSPDYWRPHWKRLAEPGKGFVVWESNRTGAFRIWRRNLDGSGLRQISPDEKGRWHYCAHVSPDGKKLVYMSFPANMWQDGWAPSPKGRKDALHLINADGSGDHVLVDNARTYQEHRAAIWHGDDELVYIDAKGFTQKMNVKTGQKRPLTREGQDYFGWLINPTKTFATSRTIWITFSPYDARTRTVTPATIYGGCQPYFSRDGVWGLYVGGSGGPLNRVHLATGKASPILRRNDPRMPPARRYVYTPMLSSSGRLFAFGAAPGRASERSPGSDYDVFVAACDPKTLELIGKPARYTFDKGNDRFPDAFLAPRGPAVVATAPNRPTDPKRHPGILAARKVVAKFQVKAKLLARARIPTPEALAPRREVLVVCEYQTAPLPGDYQPPPTRFRVARWARLDGPDAALERKKGRTYTLILERFEDNPQFRRPINFPPEKDANLPLYVETGRQSDGAK